MQFNTGVICGLECKAHEKLYCRNQRLNENDERASCKRTTRLLLVFPSRAITNSVGVSDVAIAKRSESSSLTRAANSSPASMVIFTHSFDMSVRYDHISLWRSSCSER